MITDIFLTSVLLTLVLLGFTRPYLALCVVVWVDLMKPQNLSFSFLSGKPLSLIVTAYFLVVLILNFSKLRQPSSRFYLFILPFFAVWITIATIQAEFQSIAWVKHDVVIKTLIMVFFIPFVLLNRKNFEFFIITCALSFGLFISMAGIKTILSGGGYGVSLVGTKGFMYSEGSTLATLSVSLLPIYFYLFKFSEFAEENPKIRYIFLFFVACSLATLIGTQARTGLIALAVFCVLLLWVSKRKIRDLALMLVVGLMMMPFVTDGWKSRMSTISESTTSEKSALGRIVVWRWTLDYVADKPFFGGGFYAYNANAGVLHHYQGADEIAIVQEGGKAFHNIFFEVLGESGYGGLVIYVSILAHTIFLNLSSIRAGPIWRSNLARALNASFIVYCAGGMFIGVAFYPWIYYLYAFSVALNTQYQKGISRQCTI